MAYNLPNPDQSCTLTPDERAAEAARILARIGDTRPAAWTTKAREFVTCKQADFDLWGRADVTVAQLFWLRDLAASVD